MAIINRTQWRKAEVRTVGGYSGTATKTNYLDSPESPASRKWESPSLSVSVISEEAEFDTLEADWDRLVRESDCTVFQTYEWQRTWWKYYARNRELHCLLFKEGSEIVGIAPMFREQVKLLGFRIVTRLEVFSEWYVDLIAAPARREEVARSLAAYLHSRSREWDIFEMREVNERFPVLNLLLRNLTTYGLRTHTHRGNICLQVTLPSSWEGFLQEMGTGRQRRFKRRMKKMQDNFQFEIESIRDGEEKIRDAIDEFASIYRKRWSSLGYKSWFDNPNNLSFNHEIAQKFARRGWLRIFFLKVGAARVATVFNFNFGSRIYGYQSNVYAPEEIMKCSPGLLLHYAVARQGIEEGMEVFDLIRGAQPYKMEEFECTASTNWQLRAVTPSPAHLIRFRIFLARELFDKIAYRLKNDYQTFKRFEITNGSGRRIMVRFIGSELEKIARSALRRSTRHFKQLRDETKGSAP